MPNQSTRQYVVFNETPLREFLGKQQERPADVPDERRLPLTAADIKRVLAALFEGIELEQVSVPLVTFVPGDDPCVLEPTQGVFAVTTDGPDAARRFFRRYWIRSTRTSQIKTPCSCASGSIRRSRFRNTACRSRPVPTP